MRLAKFLIFSCSTLSFAPWAVAGHQSIQMKQAAWGYPVGAQLEMDTSLNWSMSSGGGSGDGVLTLDLRGGGRYQKLVFHAKNARCNSTVSAIVADQPQSTELVGVRVSCHGTASMFGYALYITIWGMVTAGGQDVFYYNEAFSR